MNILYFASVDFFQKPNPSFHLMYSMLTDFINRGDHIYYVGCAVQGVEKHIPADMEDNPRFHYRLVRMPDTAKSHFAKRYIDGIQYALAARIHIKEFLPSCDIIFIQSSPTALFNISVVRGLIKNKKKIIYNVQDMFPGSSIASGVMSHKWMQTVFFALQKIAYKKSDVIVAISEDMKMKLTEQGVSPDKVEVIVNWFDDTTVHQVPWDENRFVKKYDLKRHLFYVQYAGTMGYVFDYKMVLAVAEKLLAQSDIVIQMIGEGSQKQEFMEEAAGRKLTNIVFLPLEPQNMVSDVYSACSVCLIPLKEGIIGNSVPSKAGLLMACKRPIVTTADEGSLYNDTINKQSIGIARGTNEPERVAEAILYLKDNPQICTSMGEKGYAYGHTLYSRKNNVQKYIDLFNRELANELSSWRT